MIVKSTSGGVNLFLEDVIKVNHVAYIICECKTKIQEETTVNLK